LLSDEAAVWARLGDHFRASELLRRAREVFADLASESRSARVELAVTDGLVARMALHAKDDIRQDHAALRFAASCAAAAEKAFRELGMLQQSARARETLGSLELIDDRADEARGHLQSALQEQRHLGDAIGLARSTAAYAELLSASGASAEALELLAESVELNVSKGSVRGARYNKKALDDLARRMTPRERRELADELKRIAQRIDDGMRKEANGQREALSSARFQ
jgi:hypothetical protein